jgi:hypothetical protein
MDTEQRTVDAEKRAMAQQRDMEEFKQLGEFFRFYTNLMLQTVTLVLSATGAVVAYMVKESDQSRYGAYGFLIPAALCVGMGAGFLANTLTAAQLRVRLKELKESLGFGLVPHAGILVWALAFFGVVMTVTGGTLTWLFFALRPH